MGLSNYPPNVTGSESAITGEWSADELNDLIPDAKRKIEDTVDEILGTFDDQSALNSRDEKSIEEARDVLMDALGDLELQTEPDYD